MLNFVAFLHPLAAQDSTFVQYFYSGSRFTVPPNCIWVIDKAFIGNEGEYQIQIANTHFNPQYQTGDILIIPYYVAEMELITSRSLVRFALTIHQTNLN